MAMSVVIRFEGMRLGVLMAFHWVNFEGKEACSCSYA